MKKVQISKLRLSALPRWLRDITPLIFWMALIFILSDQSTLIEIEDEATETTFYKLNHIIAYGVLTWLWWRALTPGRQVSWPVLALAFGLAVLYGISDEIHQLFVPGRFGRVADVLFDASGALLMILLLRWLDWLRFFPETFPFRLRLDQIKKQPRY